MIYDPSVDKEDREKIEIQLDGVRDLAEDTLMQLKEGDIPEFLLQLPSIKTK